MKRFLARLRAIAAALYNFAGDRRTKNCLLILLGLMTAFGIFAPEQATSIRDTLLSLAL